MELVALVLSSAAASEVLFLVVYRTKLFQGVCVLATFQVAWMEHTRPRVCWQQELREVFQARTKAPDQNLAEADAL